VKYLKTLAFLTALLVLFCTGIASAADAAKSKAKSHAFTIVSDTKVGDVVLTRGDYKVKVEGANAIFKNEENGKTVSAPVKVEQASETFDKTMLHTMQDGSANRLTAIELKGTQTLLKFN